MCVQGGGRKVKGERKGKEDGVRGRRGESRGERWRQEILT